MKTINLTSLIVIIALIFLFSNCEKKDQFEFGDTQSGFVIDSVYKASSDGLLQVQLVTSGMISGTNATIYGGSTSNPTDTIGKIISFGSITLPIQENTYWKVTINEPYGGILETIIQWTPIKSQ